MKMKYILLLPALMLVMVGCGTSNRQVDLLNPIQQIADGVNQLDDKISKLGVRVDQLEESKSSLPEKEDVRFVTVSQDGSMVLFKVMGDGTIEKTGLSVPHIGEVHKQVGVNIVVSNHGEKVVYGKWTTAEFQGRPQYGIGIFVANIDGSELKQIAAQEVPEGSGQLNHLTLRWGSDDSFVTYNESGITCPPNKQCDGYEGMEMLVTTYQVNVETLEKREIESRFDDI